jgi:hypothetical protein
MIGLDFVSSIFSFDAKENVRNIPDNIANATIPYP